MFPKTVFALLFQFTYTLVTLVLYNTDDKSNTFNPEVRDPLVLELSVILLLVFRHFCA